MFYRGQKIIVTESSVSKRHHPSVGDIGYLNNMYLFYADRFILLDAIFSSYKSDKSTEPSRYERKKLIIDLGISPYIRQKMITTGMPKKFFLNNKFMVPLTTAGYFISAGQLVGIPHINGADGLWNRIYNKAGKTTIQTSVKIPIGHIGLASIYSGCKGYIGQSDLKAWIRSMTPYLNAHVFELLNINMSNKNVNTKSTIRNRTGDLYMKLLPLFKTKEAPAGTFLYLPHKKDISSINTKLLIDTIREFQTLSFMYINRSDDHLINSLDNSFSGSFRNDWSHYQRWNTMKGGYVWKFDLILSIMFRAILTPGYPYAKLTKIKRFLPISDSNLASMCDRIHFIRKEGTTSSAALARIFEEKLLKQKKSK